MAETIVLTTPEVVQMTNTEYRLSRITFDRDASTILVLFRGANGEQKEWRIEGDVALQRMKALMTADLSTKSLQRRIMEAAVQSGFLTGTVTGTPE